MIFNLTIEWFEEPGNEEIPQEHSIELEAHGLDKSREMIVEGFICGELTYEIDDITYRGWWSIGD